MLNVKYWRIFGDVISLLAQIFIVSVDRAYKDGRKDGHADHYMAAIRGHNYLNNFLALLCQMAAELF